VLLKDRSCAISLVWIQLVDCVWLDGSGQSKERVSLLHSDEIMLQRRSAYSRMFLKRYL
jgi:hypothetical protein